MTARRVNLNDYTLDLHQAVTDAAEALRRGELLVVPTETVYGVAAKPDVAAAQGALAALRGEQAARPLTPHLHDAKEAERYLGPIGSAGQTLMRKLWPGPVALVFDVDADRRASVADKLGVTEETLFAADGRITLRCPDEPALATILELADQPVIVTRTGLPTGAATTAPAEADLGDLPIAAIYDGGPTRYSRPSTVVRVLPDGESWEVVREGIYDRRIIERLLRTTILFVCSGNTCRSPMAMALARKTLAEQLGVKPDQLGEQGYDVISAGSFAMPDMRAAPAAIDAMSNMGGDLAAHRSRPLDVATIHRADLIVTMGDGHRQAVLNLVPSAADKTIQLDPSGDIEDPIGSSAEHYRQLAERMEPLIRQRIKERFFTSNDRR